MEPGGGRRRVAPKKTRRERRVNGALPREKRIAVRLRPLYFNYSANLKWHASPLLTFEALAEMGYKAMHVSQGGMRPSMQAAWDQAVDLRARGAGAEVDFEKRSLEHPMGGFHAFAGFGRFKELEAKYLPVEEVKKRYDGSEGL